MRIKYRIKYIVFCVWLLSLRVLPGGSVGKESAWNEGDPGSIPGSERSPGEGNSNPLQYSCLENSMDRGAWWAIVHGVTKSRTRLSDWHLVWCFWGLSLLHHVAVLHFHIVCFIDYMVILIIWNFIVSAYLFTCSLSILFFFFLFESDLFNKI